MSHRRPSAVLLLVVSIAVLGLVVGIQGAFSFESGPGTRDAVATGGEQAPGAGSAGTHSKLEDGRKPAGGQRSTKAGLGLVAVLGVLAALPALLARRTTRSGPPATRRATSWSPNSGRAPPLLQVAVH